MMGAKTTRRSSTSMSIKFISVITLTVSSQKSFMLTTTSLKAIQQHILLILATSTRQLLKILLHISSAMFRIKFDSTMRKTHETRRNNTRHSSQWKMQWVTQLYISQIAAHASEFFSRPYNCTWNDCWRLGLGAEMNGFVLWISGLLAPVAHSATVVVSNGSPGASDFDLDCPLKAGALRGAGDVFLTISFSHWSAFGSGLTVSMGTTFCGDDGGETVLSADDDNKAKAGDGARGKVSAILLLNDNDDTFADVVTSTRLLNRDGIIGGSSTISCCWIGIAVPIGIEEFAIENNGRYGVTVVIGLVTVFGGAGIWFEPPADDMLRIPLANFSKLRKSSVSLVVRSESPWLSSLHNSLTVSICWGDTSGIGDTAIRCDWWVSRKAFWRSAFDGRSLIRNDICRLKGDWAPIWVNPRKLPCRSSIDGVACGRSIANGL